MNKLLLLLLLIPTFAEAKLIISGGPEIASGIESDIDSSDGDPSLETPVSPGLRGEVEYGHKNFPKVTVFGSVTYNQGPGRTEYDYTDSDQSVTVVDDVKSTVSLTRFTAGIRYRFLEQNKMNFFAGGGYQFGILNVNLDRGNFKGKALVTDDFEQNENQNLRGFFGELGGEMRFDGDFGIRLAAQLSSVSTDSFEILGDRKVDFKLATVAVSYVWYVN